MFELLNTAPTVLHNILHVNKSLSCQLFIISYILAKWVALCPHSSKALALNPRCGGPGLNNNIHLCACVYSAALPPPVLPPFCPLFASLVNILQCDVLLGMLGAVLQWAVEPSGGQWSESMLQRVGV